MELLAKYKIIDSTNVLYFQVANGGIFGFFKIKCKIHYLYESRLRVHAGLGRSCTTCKVDRSRRYQLSIASSMKSLISSRASSLW